MIIDHKFSNVKVVKSKKTINLVKYSSKYEKRGKHFLNIRYALRFFKLSLFIL